MLFDYSDIELVVRKSKTLERCLRQDFGAKGESLGQLIKSVEGKLPADTIQQLKRVNGMRNKVVHEERQDRLEDRREFVGLCDNLTRSLNHMAILRQTQERFQWFLGLTFVTAVSIIYILLQNPA